MWKRISSSNSLIASGKTNCPHVHQAPVSTIERQLDSEENVAAIFVEVYGKRNKFA